MRLNEIFDHLSFGEFRQLGIADPDRGGVHEENRYQLISHINLALTDLHRRFFLRQGRASVYVVAGLREYVVDGEGLLKIEQVYDARGCELPLNDVGDPCSLITTRYNTLQVPASMPATTLSVVYRAGHETLDQKDAAKNPDRVEVELPPSHLWPLLLFVASRYFTPMGASEAIHDGNNYAAKYEAACQQLQDGGFELGHSPEDSRFVRNGWV